MSPGAPSHTAPTGPQECARAEAGNGCPDPRIGAMVGRGPAFPYKAQPHGEEPGLGRPRFCHEAGRPARRTRLLAVPGPSNGRDQVVEEAGQDGKDLVQLYGPGARGGVLLILSQRAGRGWADYNYGSGFSENSLLLPKSFVGLEVVAGEP